MTARIATQLAAIALLTGCGNPLQFTDDVDLTLDFVQWLPFVSADDSLLHTPYVRGAPITFYVRDHRERGEQLSEVWARSSDPDIFEVTEQTYDLDDDLLIVRATTTGAGEAWLEVVEADGSVWDSVAVEVAFPDRVELFAAGPMMVDHPNLAASTTDARVLDGGVATFQARYFEGDRQLFGNGALAVSAPPEVGAETDQTWLFENREWVRVQPTGVGSRTVDLVVDGEAIDAFDIEVVAGEDIVDVQIFAQDTSDAEVEDWRVLLAQPFDANNEPIYGVECYWSVNGTALSGEGDLLRYEFDPETQATITASYDGLEATAVALASGGFVDSSNNIGCSVAGGLPAATWLWLGLPLLVSRRRRQSVR